MHEETRSRIVAELLGDLQEYFNKSDALGGAPVVLMPLRERIDDKISALVFDVDDRDTPTKPDIKSPYPPPRETPGPWNADRVRKIFKAKHPKG